MKVRLLKDNWTLTVLGDNVYHIPETPIETNGAIDCLRDTF